MINDSGTNVLHIWEELDLKTYSLDLQIHIKITFAFSTGFNCTQKRLYKFNDFPSLFQCIEKIAMYLFLRENGKLKAASARTYLSADHSFHWLISHTQRQSVLSRKFNAVIRYFSQTTRVSVKLHCIRYALHIITQHVGFPITHVSRTTAWFRPFGIGP